MTTPLEVRRRYTTWYIIRFPIWPGIGFLNKYVFPLLIKANAVAQNITVHSAAFISPDGLIEAEASGKLSFAVPPEFKSGRGKPWALVVDWEMISDTAGKGYAEAGIGLEGVTKLILAVGLVVLGALTYRAFTTASDVLTNPAKSPLFNPGLVVAAVVIVAVVFLRR